MTNASDRSSNEFSGQENFPMQRELIVIAKREVGLRATRDGVASVTGSDVTPLADLLASVGVTLRPLFGSEQQIQERTAAVAAQINQDVPNLSVYYRVDAPDDRLDELATQLRQLEVVEAAYIKPPAEPAVMVDKRSHQLNRMMPQAAEAPAVTPDFTPRQGYLNAAPEGIDARYAWTLPGGSGAGVGIIDIEYAWRFTHEDLMQNQGGVVGGTEYLPYRDHGTAVIGEIGSDGNTFGCTGICPDANVRAIAAYGELNSAGAIRIAADMLAPGDIILVELHRPGPRFNFENRADQGGFIALEWWPDDFDAIRYATSKGVIVVEAAGNGAENLDDAIYNTPGPGFPSDWTNPFNRVNRDSGAIVVGAGAPPLQTHGQDWGPDRSRLDFSNYGSSVDAQGWGREVTTCGYGDLQGGSDEDLWYTDRFSGTSSASPIIVGTLGCVQGVLRARGMTVLTPLVARNLLLTTGSPQQEAPSRPTSQRIGNRPNLREILARTILVNLKVALRAYNGQYVSAEGGGGAEVVANRDEVGEWETFELIELEGTKIALRAYNGQYISAEGGGGGEVVANRDEIGEWETFDLVELGDNKIALRVYNGQYISAEGGGGAEVVANRDEVGEWETFELIKLS